MPKLDEGRTPGGNSQNVERGSALALSSHFNLNATKVGTRRFGFISPSFAFRGVRGDKQYYHPIESHQSYTLHAPLMQDIDHYKDFYLIPLEAILPNNWDKVLEQPKLGDDTPRDENRADLAYCAFPLEAISSIHRELFTNLSESVNLTNLFRTLLFDEMVYSEGGLLSLLGEKISPVYRGTLVLDNGNTENAATADMVLDAACSALLAEGGAFYLQVSGVTYYVVLDNSTTTHKPGDGKISFFSALDLMRDNLSDFQITYDSSHDYDEFVQDLLDSKIVSIDILDPVDVSSEGNFPIYIDLSKAFAYQIVCAHYYTNDNVDYIYSAELYRQYLRSIFIDDEVEDVSPSFSWNGINCLFDATSLGFYNAIVSTASLTALIRYWSAILQFRNSLRYRDFFTGAKTRPLAIGDTNTPVVNNAVNVIDTTRSIQWQRFLNAVNRIPRKLEGYLEGLFPGRRLAPDYHNPFFLAGVKDTIYTVDNVNSTFSDNDDPNNVRANFRGDSSRFGFEFNLDRPSIIIGVDYYDISRLYAFANEKQNFIKSRDDMYNPYFEFIGDQEITSKELTLAFDYSTPWGYQTRYMQYKQRFNTAYGGAIRYLPGFAFIANADSDLVASAGTGEQLPPIGPSFIRARTTELDRFYLNLTGFSLASRFHFIVKTTEELSGSRSMAYSPNILS